MRALQLTAYDGPDALVPADVAEPAPRPDEALVRVDAIGVNFPDLLITTGAYQHKPRLPFVPGCEIAGEVLGAPPASGFAPGDRVAAFVWQGGYAERATVPVTALMRLPEGVAAATGAAMVVNFHTTHFALHRRGRLTDGETLLVLGAAGGIGTAAVQVGRALGARVIGGVADEAQHAPARSAGAARTLVLAEGFASSIREMTDGRGVDVVLDPLGDWLFDEGVRCLAPEGRILVVGFAAGAIPHLKVNRLLLRNASAVGVGWGAFLNIDPTVMSATAGALTRMLVAGGIDPEPAAVCTFEEIPDALCRLQRGAIHGKLVAAPPS